VSVEFECDAQSSHGERGGRAFGRLLGTSALYLKRADGKPEASDGRGLSASHTGGLTMAVAGPARLGCDIEGVAEQPAQSWRDLLGGERFRLAQLVAGETNDSFDAAATRVWAAVECLKKVGAGVAAPLVFEAAARDGWALLSSGALRVAVAALRVEGVAGRLVIAVAAEVSDASV
jgi:enediyne polyketide synthase